MAKMTYPVDLRGMESKLCDPCSPVEHDKRGPSVTLLSEEPYDLPDDGVMLVQFKVRKREEYVGDGGKRYEVRLELTEIQKVKDESPTPPATSGTEAGDALDKLRAGMEE